MDFYEYQNESRKTWIPDSKNGFIRSVLGLCGESGEIAEKVKKHYRGDCKVESQEICKELGDLLYYIARVADYCKLDLHTIAIENIKKLQSRKNRDKIKGSGDNR